MAAAAGDCDNHIWRADSAFSKLTCRAVPLHALLIFLADRLMLLRDDYVADFLGNEFTPQHREVPLIFATAKQIVDRYVAFKSKR